MRKLQLLFVTLLFVVGCQEKPTAIDTDALNKPPTAAFTVTPASGATQTIFKFDASGSTDDEDEAAVLQVRWDLENDGTWNTNSWTIKTASHQYSTVGNYTIKLEVQDSGGLTNTTTKQVAVAASNTLLDMILVEGGTFTMGDTWGDGRSDEQPTRQVTLSSFSISKYEITQAQYLAVMGTNPSDFSGDNKPVEKVTWYDAVTFCNKLSQREQLTPAYTINGANVSWDTTANGYRLPTEAEWEYAARGGSQSQGYKYSGSDNVGAVAWFDDNSRAQTHDVGTKQANELGLYDMSGNVYEWCWDWYDWFYNINSPRNNPTGPSSGSYRVSRGGKWASLTASGVRLANRLRFDPDDRSDGIGFRCVRNAF